MFATGEGNGGTTASDKLCPTSPCSARDEVRRSEGEGTWVINADHTDSDYEDCFGWMSSLLTGWGGRCRWLSLLPRQPARTRLQVSAATANLLLLLCMLWSFPSRAIAEIGPIEITKIALIDKRQLVITYDINASRKVPVSLLASTNGGASYDLLAITVSGDIGPDVVPAKNRRISWRVSLDYPDIDPKQLRIYVVCDAKLAKAFDDYIGATRDFEYFDSQTEKYMANSEEARRNSETWGTKYKRSDEDVGKVYPRYEQKVHEQIHDPRVDVEEFGRTLERRSRSFDRALDERSRAFRNEWDSKFKSSLDETRASIAKVSRSRALERLTKIEKELRGALAVASDRLVRSQKEDTRARTSTTQEGKSFMTLEGEGPTASKIFDADPGVYVAHMTHRGDSNFAVWLLSLSGKRLGLLANEIGYFDNSRVLVVPEKGGYLFDVQADGPWGIQVKEPAVAKDFHKFSGYGAGVSSLFQLEKGVTLFEIRHTGSGYLGIWLKNKDGQNVELLANKVGDFRGAKAVAVSAGLHIIDVQASGPWEIFVTRPQ